MKVNERELLKNLAEVTEVVATKNDELEFIFGPHMYHDPNDCLMAMIYITLKSSYANLCNVASFMVILLDIDERDLLKENITKRSDA